MINLEETLKEYSKSDMYPFHMPGHKRNVCGVEAYSIDMTEVEGVDDLHDPEDVLLYEQQRLADIYGSDHCFMLVGGSTVGNLSAIYAALREDDEIIIQRNSHKSVYNAAIIRHLQVDYIFPDIDDDNIYRAVSLDIVKEAIASHPLAKAVVLTSPTYEGYHCDIKAIADICHENNMLLIVDQAHGAHLGFNDSFRESAAAIADICIQSLHKTLPSLTQTAVMHVNGNRVDIGRIREALDIFETSSPSYVLMNSISHCASILEKRGDLFEHYVDNLQCFYQNCGKLKRLKVLEEPVAIKDPGKIIISTKEADISGPKLAKKLREEYKIETELSSFTYVLAMTSIMDTKQGFDRLEAALIDIDSGLKKGLGKQVDIDIRPVKAMEPWQAKAKGQVRLSLSKAKGQTAAGMVCIYPPGVPVLSPGEMVTAQTIELIKKAKKQGLHVTGIGEDTVSVVN